MTPLFIFPWCQSNIFVCPIINVFFMLIIHNICGSRHTHFIDIRIINSNSTFLLLIRNHNTATKTQHWHYNKMVRDLTQLILWQPFIAQLNFHFPLEIWRQSINKKIVLLFWQPFSVPHRFNTPFWSLTGRWRPSTLPSPCHPRTPSANSSGPQYFLPWRTTMKHSKSSKNSKTWCPKNLPSTSSWGR